MDDDTKVEESAGRLPPNAGKGRPKGSQNKITSEVKQMILEALEGVGGVEYLMEQAKEKPAAFLTLLGKVMPLQVAGSGDEGQFVHEIIRRVVDPKQ